MPPLAGCRTASVGRIFTLMLAFERYLELRAGLDLRVFFLPDGGDLFLMCVCDHDEIKSYVRGNP